MPYPWFSTESINNAAHIAVNANVDSTERSKLPVIKVYDWLKTRNPREAKLIKILLIVTGCRNLSEESEKNENEIKTKYG